MDIQGLGLILTGIAGMIGVLWTIYAGRKTMRQQQASNTIADATQIIKTYREENAYKDQQIASLTARVAKLEAANARLMRLLAKALNVPINLIDMMIEDPASPERPSA